jgi:hypothetical protein
MDISARGKDFPEYLHRFLSDMDASKSKMFTFTEDGGAFHVQISDVGLGGVLRDRFGHESVALFAQKLVARGWTRFVAYVSPLSFRGALQRAATGGPLRRGARRPGRAIPLTAFLPSW